MGRGTPRTAEAAGSQEETRKDSPREASEEARPSRDLDFRLPDSRTWTQNPGCDAKALQDGRAKRKEPESLNDFVEQNIPYP